MSIVPYISEEVPRLRLAAAGVTTVVAERTFWDKIVILHGVRNWFEKRGVLRGQGQRVSRDYYDVHRIFQSELAARAVADRELGAAALLTLGCSSAARTSASIAQFQERSLCLRPMRCSETRRDYARMSGMIIGAPPDFDKVMSSVAAVEKEINR